LAKVMAHRYTAADRSARCLYLLPESHCDTNVSVIYVIITESLGCPYRGCSPVAIGFRKRYSPPPAGSSVRCLNQCYNRDFWCPGRS